MADIIGDVIDVGKGFIPKVRVFGMGGFNIFAWGIIAILFLFIVGVFAFFIIRLRKYNKKIVVFEKINGIFQETRYDRAMEARLSTSGDSVFYLMRHKKYLPCPTLQMGARKYWYFIRSDGEWINFRPTDLDLESKKMGAKMLHQEARFARTQIQKGLKERYDKPGFWQQYGLLVFSIGYIAIIGVMTWLLFDKWIDLAGVTNSGMEMSKTIMIETMEKANEIIAKLDNICTGGPGWKTGG